MLSESQHAALRLLGFVSYYHAITKNDTPVAIYRIDSKKWVLITWILTVEEARQLATILEMNHDNQS